MVSAILTKLTSLPIKIWSWLFALHLDPKNITNSEFIATDVTDGKYPYSTEKDGYGPFGMLATFTIGQSVALTAVAKDEGRKLLVLTIYLGLCIFTSWWIRSLLTSTRLEKRPSKGQSDNQLLCITRAYDQPSIRFGRFTLFWTVSLGIGLGILYYKELLPNQSTRVALSQSEFTLETKTLTKYLDPKIIDTKLSYWLQQIERGTDSGSGEQCFIVETDNLTQDYKSFRLVLSCDENYVITTCTGFEKSQINQSYKYTQLTPTDSIRPIYTNNMTFLANTPNKGSRILFLINARHKDYNPKWTDTQKNDRYPKNILFTLKNAD